MNQHNPNGVKVKTGAILDNEVLVFVERMTKGQMFSTVSRNFIKWKVMTCRLRPDDGSVQEPFPTIWAHRVGELTPEQVEKIKELQQLHHTFWEVKGRRMGSKAGVFYKITRDDNV